MEIRYVEEVEEFINSLDARSKAKLARIIGLLEQYGHTLRTPHSKPLGEGLYELRLGGFEVRILYTFADDAAILLHGFIKKSMRIPQKHIEYAREQIRSHKVIDNL